MAARRYEISLRVLKNISRVSAANEWNIFQHEKRNFVSPSGHVMFYLLYKHQWNAKLFHFNINFFCCEGAMYHVAIATVIFSHVKITCYFHMWRYHVFARKLTWYFIGIYIINTGIALGFFDLGPGTHMSGQIGVPKSWWPSPKKFYCCCYEKEWLANYCHPVNFLVFFFLLTTLTLDNTMYCIYSTLSLD